MASAFPIEAVYMRKTGFRDQDPSVEPVKILAFIYGKYAPGYQSHGTKECTIAIVSNVHGVLFEAELSTLQIQTGYGR